jgi:hypothetical protein
MPPTITSERKTRQRKQIKMPLEVQMMAMAKAGEVSSSIGYLVSEGITASNIAREVGCSRWMIWAWQKGRYLPRDPSVAFALLGWAEHVRALKAWRPLEAAMKELRRDDNDK